MLSSHCLWHIWELPRRGLREGQMSMMSGRVETNTFSRSNSRLATALTR
jgi:hypothetical protein